MYTRRRPRGVGECHRLQKLDADCLGTAKALDTFCRRNVRCLIDRLEIMQRGRRRGHIR